MYWYWINYRFEGRDNHLRRNNLIALLKNDKNTSVYFYFPHSSFDLAASCWLVNSSKDFQALQQDVSHTIHPDLDCVVLNQVSDTNINIIGSFTDFVEEHDYTSTPISLAQILAKHAAMCHSGT